MSLSNILKGSLVEDLSLSIKAKIGKECYVHVFMSEWISLIHITSHSVLCSMYVYWWRVYERTFCECNYVLCTSERFFRMKLRTLTLIDPSHSHIAHRTHILHIQHITSESWMCTKMFMTSYFTSLTPYLFMRHVNIYVFQDVILKCDGMW